ncbi:MAG: hypothetical protein ACRD1P_01645 [Thermoanaerobaculia bacterium]
MTARRRLTSGLLAAAALLPALLWLWPAVFSREAPSFRDQGDFFYPLKLYTADRLRAGEIPLWNPLSGMGEPWLANLQSGVFYPLNLLFFFPSPALSGALFLLSHFAIAAWGARRFLKEEGVSDAAALVGAASYAGCGFAASLSVYWNHFGAWAYLPAIASFSRSGLSSRSARLTLAALLGLQAMAGSPELTGATLLVVALFAWEAMPARAGWSQPSRWRTLARAGAAAALGLALAGWALLPASELALRSSRRVALPDAQREAGSVGVPAISSALGLSQDSSGTSYLPSVYLGPLALFAASAAFVERPRRRLIWLLVLLAALGAATAMSGPPGSWLRALPVLDRVRYPAKALVLTSFGLSMMAGLGADSLRFFRPRSRHGLALPLLGAAGLALLFFSGGAANIRWTAGAGLCALLLLTLGAGRTPRIGALLEGFAALCLVASLGLASRAILRFAPEVELRRPPKALASFLSLPGRVLTPPMSSLVPWVLRDTRFDAETLRRQRESLQGYTNLLDGVRTVRTAAPLPTAAADRIASSIDGAGDLERAAGPVSARVLWTPFQPLRLGSRKTGDFFLAPLNPYRPRLSFVAGYRVEPDADRAWDGVVARDGDWAKEVVLDREPAPRPSPRGRRAFVVASIVEDRAERVVAEVACDAAGLLVLTDLHYPGWTVAVDGHRAELLRADGYFRAVALPEGAHRVVFRFRPVSFYAGAAASVAALLLLGGLWLAGEPVNRESVL